MAEMIKISPNQDGIRETTSIITIVAGKTIAADKGFS
jgi:hypothetical protein